MSRSEFYRDDTIQKAYTAKKLLDLAYLIQGQAAEVYRARGMVFPVICSSTLLRLADAGPASVTQIAAVLEHPHQTITQHLNALIKLGIAEKRPDESDKRRFEFHLTPFGEEQAALLKSYNAAAARVFTELDEALSVTLSAVLDGGITALKEHPLAARFEGLD